MPTAYFLLGLPGSGKTTIARQLERDQDAIVFAEDAWMHAFYQPEDVNDGAKRSQIKRTQWDLAAQLLTHGIDCVFDWGIWTRAERDRWRALVAPTGAEFKLIYLDVPLEELHRRIALRNQNPPPDTFFVQPHLLDEWAADFEPPDPDEQA